MDFTVSCVYFLPFLAFILQQQQTDADCGVFRGHDFSAVDGLPWIVESVSNTSKSTYKISLCKELSVSDKNKDCPEHTAVCRYTDHGAISIGNTTSFPVEKTRGELLLMLEGAPCPGNPHNITKTFISFKCGKTLGSPSLLQVHACDTYFEWHTSVACKTPPTVSEVKCYVYDSRGHKHDLTPLIKLKGGHRITSESGEDFYINVCREITPNGSTSSCPTHAAACKPGEGGAVRTGVDRGQPKDQLSITSDDKLFLQYVSTTTPAGCEGPASTSITFICPERGAGSDPLLTSNLNCHYDIEWRTEFACREEFLVSDSCSLTDSQHGVDIDLTPLSKNRDDSNRYKVTVVAGEKNYTYFLNVCGDVGIGCPNEATKERVAACQLNLQDPRFGKVMGRSDKMTLRYSDGELTLTYRDGDRCSSHFQRETVVNFHCDKNAANNGVGRPEFVSEETCTYLFDWRTKYACNSAPTRRRCVVNHGNHRIDLGALRRTDKDGNWEALHSEHVNGEKDDDRYFINVCEDVVRVGEASGCPAGAAVCVRDKGGQVHSLGSLTSDPEYKSATQSVQLHLTGGGQCAGGKKMETYITFTCKPGDLESGPSLVEVSEDRCSYKFKWETAAACITGVVHGSDCRVADTLAGFTFDISGLKKSGDQAFYKLSPEGSSHDYYMNVCGETQGTPCDQAGKDTVGVCQVTRANPKQLFSTGQASSVLHYYNGMINLTYTGGDPYASTPPVTRKTEIAFLCDHKAGVGKPEFVREANHTYNFRWFTSYSCPRIPVECMITDDKTGKQYDLSSLALTSEQGNWNTMDNSAADSTKQRKFYLNLCRPINLVKADLGCDPMTSVCMTHFVNGQESVLVRNVGQAIERPTILGEGKVLVTYRDGAPCRKLDGTNSSYSTTIELQCLRGELTSSPRFLQEENCRVAFLWQTAAACPLGDTDTVSEHKNGTAQELCTVKDSNSDFVFNLKPLMKKPSEAAYTVSNSAGTRTFKFNVCSALHVAGCGTGGVEGAAGICEGSTSLARANGDLHLTSTGAIYLEYEGDRLPNGEVKKVKIFFKCNQTAIMGTSHVSQEGTDRLELTFETALACRPQPVDCLLTDSQGHQFDLSSLARTSSNWEAKDSRPNHTDLKYYINICRPLNPVSGNRCPGGSIGGCQVTSQGSYNLGYVQSTPLIGMDGSLSLRYLNGDLCHKGTLDHRSMRIIFQCSDVQHEPVFNHETDDCEYIFSWRTPSACPIKSVTGDNCRVVEPRYHTTFDLSQLHKRGSSDYVVRAGTYSYELNVCGPLNTGQGECVGALGVGACQTKETTSGTTRINAGKSNKKLTYNDGEITLTYTGGKGSCHRKYERKTIMTFVCDHKTVGLTGPQFLNETSECTYLFEWPTAYACMPFQLSDCALTDDQGLHYDISQLTLTNDNYVVVDSGRKYLLNVCTTIVHQKGVTCPPNSASCMVDESDPKKRFIKLGQLADRQLKFDDHGNIELTYTGGENCSDNSRQRKTVVTFVCKKDAVVSQPELEVVESDCMYRFRWETNGACPLSPPTSGGANCTVTNPATGYTFDLRSLARPEGYKTTDHHNPDHHHLLDINVCGPLTNSACDSQSGACQVEEFGEKRHWNAGKANANLQYGDGTLNLTYSGGDRCHHNNLTRTTFIWFVCAMKGTGLGEPVFITEDDDCNYFISWHTELACEKQVQCVVEDDHGHRLDLSPLVRGSGFHQAINIASSTDPGAIFYLNVCRPLNPLPGTLCPPQAAACRIKEGEKPQSLGKVGQDPFFDRYSRSVLMVYDHGTPCEANGHKTNTTSQIMFVCQRGESLGQPKLEQITADCRYMFEWLTNVVCPEADPVYTSDCHFTDSRIKHTYDLSALRKTQADTLDYTVKSGSQTFYINMCGPLVSNAAVTAGCGSHTAVCLTTPGGSTVVYGSSTSEKRFKMEGENLKVQYTAETACSIQPSRNMSAYFIFECNTNIKGLGAPTLFTFDGGCDAVFTWRTPLACRPVVKDCSLTASGATYDLQPLSRETSSWTLTDMNGNTYWLNLCQGIHGGPESADCPPESVGCRRTKKGIVDTLGLVQTQKMHLAADGKAIVVEYSHGTDACGQKDSSGAAVLAKVRITFKCADTIGSPVLIPRKGDTGSCLYEFEWKSQVACREQRSEVPEVGGRIIDPRSGGTMDFFRLQQRHTYQVFSDEGRTKFLISLNGSVDLGVGPGQNSPEGCAGAAVCQTQPLHAQHYQSLGDPEKRQLFMEDGVLEVELSSDTVCATNSGYKVKTIIVFQCQKYATSDRGPLFIDQTKNCVYYFDWFTPHVCISPASMTGGSISPGNDVVITVNKSSGRHSRTSVIVGIVAALLTICTLTAVLYKPERRAAIGRRMRRLFCRFGGGHMSIRYSPVSSSSPDEEALLVSSSRQDWGTTTNNLPSFHDDSDEDLVL